MPTHGHLVPFKFDNSLRIIVAPEKKRKAGKVLPILPVKESCRPQRNLLRGLLEPGKCRFASKMGHPYLVKDTPRCVGTDVTADKCSSRLCFCVALATIQSQAVTALTSFNRGPGFQPGLKTPLPTPGVNPNKKTKHQSPSSVSKQAISCCIYAFCKHADARRHARCFRCESKKRALPGRENPQTRPRASPVSRPGRFKAIRASRM